MLQKSVMMHFPNLLEEIDIVIPVLLEELIIENIETFLHNSTKYFQSPEIIFYFIPNQNY